MENPEEKAWHGYLYAGGLFLSTLLASLLTAHFDYFVKKVGIKLSSGLLPIAHYRQLALALC